MKCTCETVTEPAVVHQIENNLVQHLLEQGGADPQVLDSLRGEAGQPGHLAKTVLTLEALTAPASQGRNGVGANGTCESWKRTKTKGKNKGTFKFFFSALLLFFPEAFMSVLNLGGGRVSACVRATLTLSP